MDYEFFHNLSHDEAREFFENYLKQKDKSIMLLKEEFGKATESKKGAVLDFSPESLKPLWKYFIGTIKTSSKDESEYKDEPWWIKETDSFRNNLFEFTKETKIQIARIAYYLGDLVIKNLPGCKWKIGDEETVYKNMPVVSGFKHEKELSPLVIVENLARRAVTKENQDDALYNTYQYWLTFY